MLPSSSRVAVAPTSAFGDERVSFNVAGARHFQALITDKDLCPGKSEALLSMLFEQQFAKSIYGLAEEIYRSVTHNPLGELQFLNDELRQSYLDQALEKMLGGNLLNILHVEAVRFSSHITYPRLVSYLEQSGCQLANVVKFAAVISVGVVRRCGDYEAQFKNEWSGETLSCGVSGRTVIARGGRVFDQDGGGREGLVSFGISNRGPEIQSPYMLACGSGWSPGTVFLIEPKPSAGLGELSVPDFRSTGS